MKLQRIAIIATALPIEFAAVRAHLTGIEEYVHEAQSIYDVGRFETLHIDWQVAIVQTNQGNPRAGIEVERAIREFKPSHALFVGVAGGLKDVQLGDVVAATKVYGYESGKAEEQFRPRADFGESTYAMTQRASAVARNKDWLKRIGDGAFAVEHEPTVFVGPIAAGEQVVASLRSPTYEFLRSNFSDALAVEMEGLGFLRAAYVNTQVEALVVRGISDLIAEKAKADAAGSQVIASRHAAAFAFEVLSRIVPAPSSQLTTVGNGGNMGKAWWDELTKLLAELYPIGPGDREIWSRAGGSIAELELRGSGRTSWYAALRLLKQGGGGHTISVEDLLDIIKEDFPQNPVLSRLIEERRR